MTDDGFSILSSLHEAYLQPKFFLVLWFIYEDFDKNGIYEKAIRELPLNLMHPKQPHFPRNILEFKKSDYSEETKEVEKEIVDCKKSAFVARSGELEAEAEYLTKKFLSLEFYKSKDIFMPQSFGISISFSGVSAVLRNAKRLVESGIHGKLKQEMHKRRNFKRERVVEYKPPRDRMTMDGFISTLFIICGGLAAVANFVMGGECRSYFKGWILVCVRKIRCFSFS